MPTNHPTVTGERAAEVLEKKLGLWKTERTRSLTPHGWRECNEEIQALTHALAAMKERDELRAEVERVHGSLHAICRECIASSASDENEGDLGERISCIAAIAISAIAALAPKAEEVGNA